MVGGGGGSLGSRGDRRVGRFKSIVTNSNGRGVCYLAVVNRVRNRAILSRGDGSAGCRRVVPRLITIRRSGRVRKLLMVLGAVNNSIRTKLTVTRLVSNVGGPATSFILNNNRSVNIPLTISTGQSCVTPSTAVAIRPIEDGKLFVNIPRVLGRFSHVRGEVASFMYQGSGVSPRGFRSLVVGANRVIASINDILSNRHTIDMNLVSRVNGLSRIVTKLCGLVRGKGGN